ncbi:MAG: BrnT family toxin [Acidobacteria bacterium]|nr:BrnT family toxin [Acidobacteriota bacterium]
MIALPDPVTFIWDKGNERKNLEKHGVTSQEVEEVFFDPQKKLLGDKFHSGKEDRYLLIGQTKRQRLLFVVFTIRNLKI